MISAVRVEPSVTAERLIEIRSVSKAFGKRSVLRDVSLDVSPGEFLTILGESGSGKTTLLRLIAGFEQLDSGEIWMNGERLDLLPPYRRRVNTVFQSYALFPHLSVFQNIGYGLRIRGTPRAEIENRVNQALDMVKMGEYIHSSPAKLSGGQQQRVALARALVNRPQLLLLDEPLSALDANLRRQMQLELKSLQREVGITFLFVTHDQEEAMAISDRIALLRAGQFEQIASPCEIYNCPVTAYSATFIGQTNLLRGQVHDGRVSCGELHWPTSGASGPAVFSLRPECIQMVSSNQSSGCTDLVRFRAKILSRTFSGATDLLQVQCEDGSLLRVRVPSHPPGDTLCEFEFAARDAIRVRDSEHS